MYQRQNYEADRRYGYAVNRTDNNLDRDWDRDRRFGFAVRPNVGDQQSRTQPSYDRVDQSKAQFNQQRPAVFDSSYYRSSDDDRNREAGMDRADKYVPSRSEDFGNRASSGPKSYDDGKDRKLSYDDSKGRQLPRTYDEFEQHFIPIDQENGVSLDYSDSSGDEDDTNIPKDRKKDYKQKPAAPSTTPTAAPCKQDRVQRFTEAADMVLKLIDTVLGSSVWTDTDDDTKNSDNKPERYRKAPSDNNSDRCDGKGNINRDETSNNRRQPADKIDERRAYDEKIEIDPRRKETSINRRNDYEQETANSNRRNDYERARNGDFYDSGRDLSRDVGLPYRKNGAAKVSALEEVQQKFADVDVDDRRLPSRQRDYYSDRRDDRFDPDYGRNSGRPYDQPSYRDNYGQPPSRSFYDQPLSRDNYDRQRSYDQDDDLQLDRGPPNRSTEFGDKLSRLMKTMVNSGWFQGYGVVMEDMNKKILLQGEKNEDNRNGAYQRQPWETEIERTWRTLRANRKIRPKIEIGSEDSNHFRRGMSRELAVEVLKRAELGSFIIRDCTIEYGCFALSVKILPEKQARSVAHYLVYQTPSGRIKLKDFDREWSCMTVLIRNLNEDLVGDIEFCRFLGIPVGELHYTRQGTRRLT